MLKLLLWLPTTLLMLWRDRFCREWHVHGPDQMRRWRDGAWEKRQLTEEEDTDLVPWRDW